MRRQDRQITDRTTIDAILRQASICRLGLWDGHEPYVVPLNYGYDGQALYVHCADEGRKLDIMRDHPGVCFEVETGVEIVGGGAGCAWTTRYRSVIGWGVAQRIENREAKLAALRHILAHHGGPADATFDEEMLHKTAVVRIDITRLTGKANDGA